MIIGKTISEKVKQDKEDLQSLNDQDNILRLQGKSEKDIINLKIEKYKQDIKNAKANVDSEIKLADLREKAAKRNYEIAKNTVRFAMEVNTAILRALVTPIDAIIMAVNKISEVLGFGKVITTNINELITKMNTAVSSKVADFIFDPEETKRKGEKTVKEAKKYWLKLQNEEAGLELQKDKKEKKEKKDKKKAKTLKDELQDELLGIKNHNEQLLRNVKETDDNWADIQNEALDRESMFYQSHWKDMGLTYNEYVSILIEIDKKQKENTEKSNKIAADKKKKSLLDELKTAIDIKDQEIKGLDERDLKRYDIIQTKLNDEKQFYRDHWQELGLSAREFADIIIQIDTDIADNNKDKANRIKEYETDLVDAKMQLRDIEFKAAESGFQLLESLAGKNKDLSNALFIADKGVAAAKVVIDGIRERAAIRLSNKQTIS